jgi:hypothetical protein
MDQFFSPIRLVFRSPQNEPNHGLPRFIAFQTLIAACPKAMKNQPTRIFLRAFELKFNRDLDAATTARRMHTLWSIESIAKALDALRKKDIRFGVRWTKIDGPDEHLALTPLYDQALASLQENAPEEADLFMLHVGRICLLINLPSWKQCTVRSKAS